MAYSFTNGQKRFIKSLSARTGLNQRVVAAWVFSEMNGGAARGYEKRGYYNWLNIGHTDSGNLGLTGDRTWRSPESAAKATSDFLRGRKYGPGPGIRKIINYAGKSPERQISAIANSGWATSSYEKGSTLRSIYSGLGNQFAGQPSRGGRRRLIGRRAGCRRRAVSVSRRFLLWRRAIRRAGAGRLSRLSRIGRR